MNSNYISFNNINTDSKKKANGYTILILAFILFIEFVLLALLGMPLIKKDRSSARRAACFSNIKQLQIAIEMYNMDKHDSMKSLDIDLLVNEKYMKGYPLPPEDNCMYLSEGDLSVSGIIYCKFHGEYDKKKEKELRKQERIDGIKSRFKYFILFIFICSIPSLIYLFITILSRKESYISFIILFILVIFIVQHFHQISLLAIGFMP